MLFFDQLDSSFTQTVSEVATALPPILINRFIINLQAASSTERTQLTDASTTQNESEAEFRRPSTTNFLGNIGEPLTDGSKDQFSPHTYAPFEGYYSRTQLDDGGTLAVIFCWVKNAPRGANLVHVSYTPALTSSFPTAFKYEVFPEHISISTSA
ncbi:hypothetical protein PHLGIDRAFT_122474 [Phlebiopsis gigantea 11061_1 CR5-6]|uniref:Uncharacterized protein n=1 Tax=Phlebiopsis gigantea (strain 11061_1 CR5-6) TaxID=745531 RepID=A0A0C3S3I9_PHLG1|nr:hypothetical protein PHLGIDRAFT_122474 [Phlebiopsis gigantea 11061_1 CR5-6]